MNWRVGNLHIWKMNTLGIPMSAGMFRLSKYVMMSYNEMSWPSLQRTSVSEECGRSYPCDDTTMNTVS